MPDNILILHSPLAADAPADELDVLQQAGFFADALSKIGYTSTVFAFPYDLQVLKKLVLKTKPVLVVNLVETLFADGRMVHTAPFVLEHLGVPYTGCNAHAMYTSSHKLLSKQLMRLGGVKTPSYYTYQDLCASQTEELPGTFLLKSIWEHASFGLDESKPLLFFTRDQLLERFHQEANPSAFFAEQYIHGREFNLSILGGKNGPMVLPLAEMRFNFPEDKPHILGYKAKWEEDSFEYKNTCRSFSFDPQDQPLLDHLKEIALQCWNIFELKGYARVDFRVDRKGNIFVLEINANPCISPDSGFVAATRQAGISSEQVVRSILEDTGVRGLLQTGKKQKQKQRTIISIH